MKKKYWESIFMESLEVKGGITTEMFLYSGPLPVSAALSNQLHKYEQY